MKRVLSIISFLAAGLAVLLAGVLLAGPALADVSVQISGPAGIGSQQVSGASGLFGITLPLQRNAVNNLTVTATDEYGNRASQQVKLTQISFDQLVVAQVTATPLPPERIEQLVRDGVISLDNPENFNVSQFNIVLTINEKPVEISVPIAISKINPEQTGEETYRLPVGEGSSGGRPSQPPIEIVVFEEPIPSEPGEPAPPPIPGVILIEGRIKSLKEFFSVKLLLMNTSGIFTLSNVSANLEFPDLGLSNILPADGIASFGDIEPGTPAAPMQKEKEFIIRGDEIGVKHIKVNFGGKVTGPGIADDAAIPFNGSASTSVEVKGPPTFQVQVSHPDTVVKDVPYELLVDITNTGQTPALYTSLDLDVGADAMLVDCKIGAGGEPECAEIDGPSTRSFGHIYPGEKVREAFTIMPKKSGEIGSCLGIADQNIDLQVIVGMKGCLAGNFPPNRGGADGIPAVSVLPIPNMLGVSISSPVTAFFSELMEESTITTGSTGSFRVYTSQDTLVPGRLRLEELGGKTVALFQVEDGITNRFAPNEEYKIIIDNTITDKQGYKLQTGWISTFTTTGEALDDFTLPTVTLSVEPPVNPNAVLPGQIVRLNVYASDQGSGVQRIELRAKDLDLGGDKLKLIDQKNVLQGDEPPFNFAIDSQNLTFGHTYQLQATAYDLMGNAKSTTLALVILSNAARPTITLPADPTADVPLGVSVNLTPQTTTGGVVKVSYFLDGSASSFATLTLAPYSADLPTAELALGLHTINAVVEDGLGQTGSDSYAFTLAQNTEAPTVAFSAPAAGAQIVKGILLPVAASIEDQTGIKARRFYLDSVAGTPIAVNTSAFILDTTTIALGTHQLLAVATNNIDLTNNPNSSALSFTVIDPPPAPPPPAPTVTSVSAPEGGSVSVSGITVPGSRVDVTNVDLNVTVTVYANGSGAFTAVIAGDAGDQINVVVYDGSQTNTSPPATTSVAAAPALDHISISQGGLNFTTLGAFADLIVTAHYTNGSSGNVTASSAISVLDPHVASVNAAGRVVALGNGSTELHAYFQGKEAAIVVTVNVVTLVSISLSPDEVSFSAPNQTAQLSITGHFSDSSTAPVTSGLVFTTGNQSIATVSSSGLITAKGQGQTQITVSVSDIAPVSTDITVDFGLDSPPVVQILSPAPESEFERGAQVEVSIRGTDTIGGLASITLETSGAYTSTDTRMLSGESAATRFFSFAIPDNAPIGGTIVLTAFAEDTGAQISPVQSIVLHVVDKTAPTVAITAPANEARFNLGDSITLSVSAGDSAGVTEIRYQTSGGFSLSGQQAFTASPGIRTADFTLVVPAVVDDPETVIRVWAKDASGNEREAIPVRIAVTGADIIPPETLATAVSSPGSTATLTVSYSVTSGLSDLDYVLLFFRRNGIGTFNRYTDSDRGVSDGKFHPQSGANGTILFDSTKMGGDGSYEFYTIGVDTSNNREADPTDGGGNFLPDQTAAFNAGTVWTELTSTTLIGDGDNALDNTNLRIRGAQVTIVGYHSYKNVELLEGAKLIHPETDLGDSNILLFSVWSLSIDSTSSIDLLGRGYLGGLRNGNICTGHTYSHNPGSSAKAGGSFGGIGGAISGGVPNPVYGLFTDPADMGSGGGCGDYSRQGGDGGGLVKIYAINIAADGAINADGAAGQDYGAGSGSGGGINLLLTTLSGRGLISANGGAGDVGGGGGRIAVNYLDISTKDNSLIRAVGGAGSSVRGGNGSVFFTAVGESGGTMIVDGQGAGSIFSPLSFPPGYTFTNIIIRNNARVIVDDTLQAAGKISVLDGSILTHTLGLENGLRIQAGDLYIDSTSSIDVSGKGFRGGLSDGNSNCEGLTIGGIRSANYQSGGSYGGYGAEHASPTNPSYGDPENPGHLGTGGGCGAYSRIGGNGGGRLAIILSGTLKVDGRILSQGQNSGDYSAGAGSGGSILITTSILRGIGAIDASGGDQDTGGGGGRIAVRYDYLAGVGNDLNGLRNVTAEGGRGASGNGAAGTVLFKRRNQEHGDLYIDEKLTTPIVHPSATLTSINFGTVQAVTSDTITTDGKSPTIPGALVGLRVNPNINQSLDFKVSSNTETTITFDTGGIDLAAIAVPGDTYAGVHRFDNLYFRRMGQLVVGDRLIVAGETKLDEQSSLTHYEATSTFESRLDLTTKKLTIAAGSSIDVDGEGYLGGYRSGISCYGRTVGNVDGAPYHTGGSYGGLGGVNNATSIPVYGSITDPAALGSGGGCGDYSRIGSDGGGWVRIKAEEIVVDGSISADSLRSENYSAGPGSGGSINIDTVSLGGSGVISASGAAYDIGGGGGRIAVRYQNLTFPQENFAVLGGQVAGEPSGAWGGNGTLFLKQAAQLKGDLIVDGLGTAAAYDRTKLPPGFSFDNIYFRNGAKVTADVPLQAGGAIEITNGAVLSHSQRSELGLSLTSSSILIDSTSSIDLDGRGYTGGLYDGNDCFGRSEGDLPLIPHLVGGTYGGLGGSREAAPPAVYGVITEPLALGSGGGCGDYGRMGGDGGGLAVIEAGSITIDGILSSGGIGRGNYGAGAGAGGSINIRAGTLSGGGTIRANGGSSDTSGGGGRIAVRYQNLTFPQTKFQVLGGQSGVWGGNGTLYLKQNSQALGDLVIDGLGTSAASDLSIVPDGYAFDNVRFRNGAKVTANFPIVASDTIAISSNSVLTHSAEREDGLKLVAKNVVVDAGGSINVDGRGYPGGLSATNGGCPGLTLHRQSGSPSQAGGSYGGLGGIYGSEASPAYGDPRDPVYLGSGGGCGGYGRAGGSGGGRVTIEAAESVEINGSISAKGVIGNNQYGSGGGSGGSIKVNAGLFKGAGTISAGGAAGDASGGGGRIAVYYQTLGNAGADFNGGQNITAAGGHDSYFGSAGTVYLRQSAQAFGDLLFDEAAASTNSRWTPLPHIGFGKVQAVDGNTIATDGTVPLLPGGLAGIEFNPDINQGITYRIADNTVDTITVIPGGTPLSDVAAVGDTYSGIYRFDNVTLRRGAFVVIGDKLLVSNNLALADLSLLTHPDTTLTLESRLDILAGAVTLQAGSAIDVTGRGYLGGLQLGNGCSGQTIPAGIGSTSHAAGSYGGLGSATDGTPNPTYGLAGEPAALGSGGSCGSYSRVGGDGGGWIRLEAGALNLDGDIRANGDGGGNYDAGSGSGGTINIRSTAISGTGTIQAKGGGGDLGGGGGRIAIRAGTDGLSAGQISAAGGIGSSRTGAAGTVQ